MRRYRVARREPIVRFILDALEECGAQVLLRPDPSSAPFEIVVNTPEGERLELTCYAFLANKYRQQNRPSDEHRFQVKYGSEFATYHRIFLPTRPDQVTLMFGVHIEEGLFISCDPAMHEWTRFSRSVEFKSQQLEEAQQSGWFGWERERSLARRRAALPKEDARTEVLVAFRPNQFLRYVAFERVATGMDPGERLLLADRLNQPSTKPEQRLVHPLEKELGLGAFEILDMIGGAFRLKAAVRGGAAEYHLGEHLRTVPGVSRVTPIDEDGKPDFEVTFSGNNFLIECKNVLRRPNAAGEPRVDFQKTRASKNDPCSRYYRPDQFDVLAACLHPISERWEYRFISTSSLAAHATCRGRLSQRVIVSGEGWRSRFDELIREAAS